MNQLSRLLRFSKKGLWLSIPLCGLSAIVVFGNMQSLVQVVYFPIILGLPWSIPGCIIMLMGIGHGISEFTIVVLTITGAVWIFLSVSINGAYIASRRKTSDEETTNE